MIIDYDHNPNITEEQRLQSLKESVQMALNELASLAESHQESKGISRYGEFGAELYAATSASPWVAPVSGIMVISSGTTSGQRAYWYVTDKTDGTPMARATRLETGSYQLGASFPVIKGHEYYSAKAYLSADYKAVLYRTSM
jgi:hypothetical protein